MAEGGEGGDGDRDDDGGDGDRRNWPIISVLQIKVTQKSWIFFRAVVNQDLASDSLDKISNFSFVPLWL